MSHSGRWRFAQVIMISIFGQWSGNGLGYFNPAIYETLGYTSSSMQLLLNLVNSIVGCIAALTAVYFCDRMPRRTVLVWGTLGTLSLLGYTMSCVTDYTYRLCHLYGRQRRRLPTHDPPARGRRRRPNPRPHSTQLLLSLPSRLLLHLYPSTGCRSRRSPRNHNACKGSRPLRLPRQRHQFHLAVRLAHCAREY